MDNRIFFPKLHKLDLSTLDTPTLHKLIRKLIKRLEQSTHKSNMRLKVMHGGTNQKLFDKLIELIESNNITKMNKYIGDIDIQNDDGETLLMIALRKDSSPEMIQILLNKGADVNFENKAGVTPLIIALSIKYSGKIIRAILDKDADVNVQRDDGKTPLIIALSNEYSSDIIKMLLNNGADVNVQRDDGETPLMIAFVNKYSDEIIQDILDKGADVNVKENTSGMTPLMIAMISMYSDKIIQAILDKGADVNVENTSRMTPLIIALFKKYSDEIIRAILDKGGDVNVQENINGKTPLMIAYGKQYSNDIIQAILDRNPILDKNGETKLTLAIKEKSSLDKILSIINKGADVNVQNKDGNTVLILALINKSPDIIKMLLNNGADVNVQNKDGKMAIDYAYEEYRDNDIYTTIRDMLRTRCKDDLEVINNEQINDVDDKYFYSFTIGKFKYCFDIGNLYTLLKTSRQNPWTREDIPDYIINNIKKRYNYVKNEYGLPEEEDEVPESSVMTATLASLSNLVPYMNDSTLFRNSNEGGIASFLERLVDYEVLTADDSTQLTNMTDLNAKKLALIQLVILKLKQNSQLGTNVQYAYNETFGNSEDTSSLN